MDSKTEVKMWGIHTMDDGLFLQGNLIALGWEEMGSLEGVEKTREAFKEAYIDVYKDERKMAIANCAGQLYRFVCEAQIGDYVVLPSKADRKINIGIIESDYYYASEGERYNNRRTVKWLKHLPRTLFSQGALYEVGAAQTFFSIKNNTDEFISALSDEFKHVPPPPEFESVGITADTINQSTRDYILSELRRQFKGYPLEHLVANILEAMGYKATVSPQGGDRGVDIIAYKDELPPRMLAQIKSVESNISETVVQAFVGSMQAGDYGIFVTLSEFTDNALDYIEKHSSVKGINGYDLVELFLKYYDKLDEKYRDAIPLEKVYIPIVNKDDKEL